MDAQAAPILSIEHLSFGFTKAQTILHDITFAVNPGEFVVMTGRNGSGKSLLLKCIKGILQPTGGNIFIDGKEVSNDASFRNRSIGLVFQDADSQIVGQTVERDIAFGLENLKVQEPEFSQRIESVVHLLGLGPMLHQRPRTLSGGEKRRLAIAGVLVMKPKLIILDEPFANLDYPGVVQVLQTLVELHKQGHTIMMVSHEIEKVLAHADKLVLLDSGRIIAATHPKEVLPVLEDFGVRVPSFHGVQLPLEEMTWLKE